MSDFDNDTAEVETAGVETESETVAVRVKTRVRGERKTPSRKTMPRGKKIVIGILIAVLAIIVIAVGIFLALVKMGDLSLHASPEEGIVIVHNNEYVYNENVVSILVLGLDDESNPNAYPELAAQDRLDAQCSDANMLVTINTETNDIQVIAIPRDTQIDVDLYIDGELLATEPMQLCRAYSADCGSKDACAMNTATSVSRIMNGVPINFYCALNYNALVGACDALGGVTLTALETIPGTPIIEGREMLLQGRNALRYVQYRNTHIDGSADGRLERQMQFINALFEQASMRNVETLVNVYNSMTSDMDSNLGASEVSYLATILASEDTNLSIVKLPGTIETMMDSDGVEREHVFLDQDYVDNLVMNTFYCKAEDRIG